VSAFQKWEDRSAPLSQIGARSPDPGIHAEINQAFIKYLDCIVAPSSGEVDFREVQIKLRFLPL
jgi:hypothetical protein